MAPNNAPAAALTIRRAEQSATVELPVLTHWIDGEPFGAPAPVPAADTHGPAGNSPSGPADGATPDPADAAASSAVLRDPARGTVIATIPLGGRDVVDEAVRAARAALPDWAARTPGERSELLLDLADRIAADTDRLRGLEALNCGKPHAVTQDDVASTVDTFRFMAGAGRAGTTIAAGEYVQDVTSMILREPLGVVGMVTPWNYPLLMAAWKVAAALMAGNTAVLKPSEVTPLTTLRLAELTAEVLPPGVLNVVLGDGEGAGRCLSAHPGIDMIALTGSVRAGRDVAESASGRVTRVHLELGGKAPVLVCPDADLDLVADTVFEAGYWNSGQECGAACRVLVHESVADDLAARIVERVARYRLCDPEVEDENALGPIIFAAHFERVTAMLDGAISRGAEVLLGGSSDDTAGYWVEPTVLRVAEGDEITGQEVFGPVVTLETYTEEAEALRRANAVEYGLTASVFTRDGAAAMSLAKALDFGSVNLNTHLALPTEMPWGGFKSSGYGRDLSAYALEDYSRTKHVALNHARGG